MISLAKFLRSRSFAEGGTLPPRRQNDDNIPVFLIRCGYELPRQQEDSLPECPCWPDCLEDRE